MTNPFQFPNGQLAYSAEDLLKLCQQFPDDGVNYLVREDLEKWLSYIGKQDIAEFAANARQKPLEDRQKLEEFLNKCHALSSPESRDLIETKPYTEQSPVEEPTPVAVETPVVETKPYTERYPVEKSVEEPTPVAVETPVVEAKPYTEQSPLGEPTPVKKSTEAKPSFFNIVARLIINILYRDKDKN